MLAAGALTFGMTLAGYVVGYLNGRDRGEQRAWRKFKAALDVIVGMKAGDVADAVLKTIGGDDAPPGTKGP